MSDKTSDKYRITLTGNQLALVGRAVELMMRTGMGQTMDLAVWIMDDVPRGNNFDVYIAQRDLIKGVLDGIMQEIQIDPHGNGKSDQVHELTTLHEAICYRQWMDRGGSEWDVRSYNPMQCGEEPVPEIEREDESKIERVDE